MSELFSLEDIEVSFLDFTILSDINIDFPAAKASFIIGKAGSGKSTLLKTLAGLMLPERGRVVYNGRDIAKFTSQEERDFRRDCAFGFQDAALWANQSVYNNIALPISLHRRGLAKAEVQRRVQEVALRAGYTDVLHFRPDALSAGEQKQISFARALVLDPKVLFMDEPTASLDEDSVNTVISVLKAEKEAGKTIIAVSHDPRLIAEVADLLVVVADGSVIGRGSVASMAPLVGVELARRIREAEKAIASEKVGEK